MKLKPRTLYAWYRDVISHYHQDKAIGKFATNKVHEYDAQTGEVFKEQVVHITKKEKVGASMCIDEKMINKDTAPSSATNKTEKKHC